MSDVQRNLDAWAKRQRGAAVALAQSLAGQLEGRVKKNAPWTDRTSNARNGLFGSTEVRGDTVYIRVAHSMEYGVFLELANDGRFAILKPTVSGAVAEIEGSYRRLWQ
ncbi:MAG: hypothetical protein DDT37_02011 [Firmicutes bacterium]|nr:hypothetical protein [candidate division NPL-UPA2 bacterium]